MNKIIFIEPKSPNLHIFSQFPLPRLGSYILGGMMRKRGWKVVIIYEEKEEIPWNEINSAEIVGVSTITSTAPRAYAIADKIRSMGVSVIMGGPHVTFLPDEALEHADFVIRGEGEKALMAFIDAWEKNKDFSDVPNLSFKQGEKTIHNPMIEKIEDLDEIPFPDFSDFFTDKSEVSGHRIIPIQTSRGCPYDCEFCSVTGMFGRKYRFRSTENIIQELRLYDHRKNFIFFYDDHFSANRKRTKLLLESMIKEKFKFKWSTQVRADLAKDPEMVKLMKKAGCHTLYIGLESVNPKSLSEMKKKQTVEDVIHSVKVIRKNRIHIHGMFVYGFDEDDWETVKKTVRFAKRSGLNSTQFLILTPLPGSKFFSRIRNQERILFKDWALYDAHHVVFQPAKLSLFGLQKAQIFSHKKFYSRFRMILKFIRGKWLDLGLAHYARNLNRMWQKKNKTFLKVVDLLTTKKEAKIKIDYQQEILIDR
ncbi:MAG: radical SAM protein [Candidatus Aminicenantes bacterium]|nr:radical SAM protein [Candidatus Aminicenantes bacterium]